MKIHVNTFITLFSLSAVSADVVYGRQLKKSRSGKAVKSTSSPTQSPYNGPIVTVPQSPPLPGVSQKSTPKVILAQALDYPPFTTIGDDLSVSGFSPEFAKSLEKVCDIEIVLAETNWDECWTSTKPEVIGRGLAEGTFHGCTAYTGTAGVRQRYLEFSAPINSMNKAAGILTRLVNGIPVVDGSSNLSGITVGDVTGWAPTADTLAITKNMCTGESWTGFTFHDEENDPLYNNSTLPNDMALSFLLNGSFDALWIYADQVASYKAACDEDPNQPWDCSLWSSLGTDFAYIQTGIYDYMIYGTTLAISKKGSGLKDTLDPCINAFIQTEDYKDLCMKWGLESSCFQNEFFDTADAAVEPYSLPTSELTTTCADGYCPCP
mmetsp:Transcript_43761/g.47451  ORF Transcript_43761/g.47451 Transcript_43761/m.47451 type:complete len:379 (-) Transcript_43761:164-1300(-)